MTDRLGSRAAAACALVALMGVAWVEMDALGDTFWCVALGRSILERGLSTHDAFTFTAGPDPVTERMPLSFVTFALVERFTGVGGLLVFGAFLLAAALALVWLPGTKGPLRWVLFPILPFIVFLERDDLCVRGQLCADVAFATLLLCIEQLRRAKDGSGTPAWPRSAWLAPVVLGALWMNAHPSAALAVLLAPLEGAVRVRRGPLGLAEGRAFWAFALLFLVGTCLTPYGPGLLFDAVDLARLPSTRSLDLFRSPDFRRADVMVALALATGTLIAVVCGKKDGRTSRGAWLLLFLCLALLGRRHLPWLVMATVRVLAELGRDMPFFAERRIALGSRALSAAVGLASVVAVLTTRKDAFAQVPVEGVRCIDAERLPGRVLNAYHWGGYLDYVWGPTRRVFIDGRNYLFDRNEVFFDHDRIRDVDPMTPYLLDAYGIRTILWESGSPLDRALSHDGAWRLRCRGRIEVVYTRS